MSLVMAARGVGTADAVAAGTAAAFSASGDIVPALSLHRQLRTLPMDQRRPFLADHFNGLAHARLRTNPHLKIQGLWDEGVDRRRLAANHLQVLETRYGRGGHYALDHGVDGTVERMEAGTLGVWNLVSTADGAETPVATAGLNLGHGVAEMTRAASLDGNGSAVLFARLGQFFASDYSRSVWGLQTEVRVGAEISLPSGQTAPGGAPSLHVNLHMGPLLLVSGWIYPYGRADDMVFDPHFGARLYLQPETLDTEVIYTPESNPFHEGVPSMADVGRATLTQNFGTSPTIAFQGIVDRRTPNVIMIEQKAYHQVWELKGSWSAAALDRFIAGKQADGDIVEIAVRNEAESVAMQKLLYERGFIPTGIRPGGRFELSDGRHEEVDTHLFFQLPKPGIEAFFIPLGLSRDYLGTLIGDVTERLAEVWRRRLTP